MIFKEVRLLYVRLHFLEDRGDLLRLGYHLRESLEKRVFADFHLTYTSGELPLELREPYHEEKETRLLGVILDLMVAYRGVGPRNVGSLRLDLQLSQMPDVILRLLFDDAALVLVLGLGLLHGWTSGVVPVSKMAAEFRLAVLLRPPLLLICDFFHQVQVLVLVDRSVPPFRNCADRLADSSQDLRLQRLAPRSRYSALFHRFGKVGHREGSFDALPLCPEILALEYLVFDDLVHQHDDLFCSGGYQILLLISHLIPLELGSVVFWLLSLGLILLLFQLKDGGRGLSRYFLGVGGVW
jgi:hypothetical protein